MTHQVFSQQKRKHAVTHSLLDVRVTKKSEEAPGIHSFELVEPHGGVLPAFSAGAHIDVHGPTGIVRQYSLCNHPAERSRYLIAVLRDPQSRGGSQAMHEQVQPGDILRISRPRNLFSLAPDSPHSLLLAGGIGITPIVCMAEHLADGGGSFEMHYFARSREKTAFHGRIGRSRFHQQVTFHFDDEPATTRQSLPALLASQRAGTHLYVCGPRGFLEAVLGAARARQWPEALLHYEYFGAAAVDAAGAAKDTAFEVKLASSGLTCTVAAGQTVVAALAARGVEIPVSCEQGICGTCLTRVLSGKPDHRDQFLTPEEHAANDQFLPCCSRACGPLLVLDL